MRSLFFLSLLTMLLVASISYAGETSCDGFSIRLVIENDSSNPPSYDKFQNKLSETYFETILVSKEVLLNGKSLKDAYLTKSKSFMSPKQIEELERNTTFKVLPEVSVVNIVVKNPKELEDLTSKYVGHRIAFV